VLSVEQHFRHTTGIGQAMGKVADICADQHGIRVAQSQLARAHGPTCPRLPVISIFMRPLTRLGAGRPPRCDGRVSADAASSAG
jgi:hypothetical protein